MVIGYGLVVGYPGRPSCSLGIGIGYPGLSTCSLGKVVASYRRFVLSAHYSRSYSTKNIGILKIYCNKAVL